MNNAMKPLMSTSLAILIWGEPCTHMGMYTTALWNCRVNTTTTTAQLGVGQRYKLTLCSNLPAISVPAQAESY